MAQVAKKKVSKITVLTRILIYEPEVTLCATLRVSLEQRQAWVVSTEDIESARQLLQKQFFHVVVWPVNKLDDLPELQKVRQLRATTAVVVSSTSFEGGFVAQCMRAGASHFWRRDSGVDDFLAVIDETLSTLVPDDSFLTDDLLPIPEFIGRDPKIRQICSVILNVKNSDSTVLITGESGTGKEVVARAIHSVSSRKNQPWVAINCGAIPANLLESELFGHVRGAFTGAIQNRLGRFQLAGSGTLFLDEISDLSFDLQAKILRAIQNRIFEPIGGSHSVSLNARIIAATNQDLEAAVNEKRFREDLFYRLNVIPIFIPPLRTRKGDIPLLARNFLEKFSRVNNKEFFGISEAAMQCLTQYHWPGNIRELENMMERIIVLKQTKGLIDLKDIPVQNFRNIKVDRFIANVSLPESGIDFNDAVNEFENELILQALQKTSGNKNKAATLLNLNRTTLVEKLKRKGLRLA